MFTWGPRWQSSSHPWIAPSQRWEQLCRCSADIRDLSESQLPTRSSSADVALILLTKSQLPTEKLKRGARTSPRKLVTTEGGWAGSPARARIGRRLLQPSLVLAPSVGGVGPRAQQQRHMELLGLLCDGENNLREAEKAPEDSESQHRSPLAPVLHGKAAWRVGQGQLEPSGGLQPS